MLLDIGECDNCGTTGVVRPADEILEDMLDEAGIGIGMPDINVDDEYEGDLCGDCMYDYRLEIDAALAEWLEECDG